MAALLLDGETLGKKRKQYNQAVNDTIKNKTVTEVAPIDFEGEDIDNLFKIDIASNKRNVDYILEVFKCEDMLYVSRAIKQSKWLITDEQYAHIVNPEYLFHELFPQMMSKAKNKFLLTIRLNLKEKHRVEEFCKYLMLQNLQMGLKWLPHCSFSFIKETVEKHASEIPTSLIKRLCEQSITIFEIYSSQMYYVTNVAQKTLFLLNEDTEKYLDLVEPSKFHCRTPKFGPKQTQKIMSKCPHRIINNFENYAEYIDMRVFAKFIKESEMKNFIIKHMKNDNTRYNLKTNIDYFLKRIPCDERFEFIKTYFIDKSLDENSKDTVDDDVDMFMCSAPISFCMRDSTFTSFNIYKWYKFAPYVTAFKDLKKLIKSESNPSERNAMLTVILQCAGKDINNIQSLVQYYRENHINEPFIFKKQFIYSLLSKTDICKYDLKTWNHLNDIFTSMEVYEESNNDVRWCIVSIILYNLMHDITIPKIIEDKFSFDTFKKFQNLLGDENKVKVFNYLYNNQTDKLNNLSLVNERVFYEALSLLENILNLLNDWKKNLSDYPTVLENIKMIASIKKQNSWKIDISRIYHIKKSWRKLLFNESILICPTAKVAINALKHNSELINTYIEEMFVICSDENMLVKRFLNTIRVFWSQTLASIFKKTHMDAIEKKNNYAPIMFGLATLLPQKEFLALIHKYEPTEAKIDWSQQNESVLGLRRNLAKRLHLARPQPPLSAALLYAHGDYLQYVLPSLSSILYNISAVQSQNQLKYFLIAPVSLQKHGIRTAINKLPYNEIKLILTDRWHSTKNSSIRANVFNQTFKLLCKQSNCNTIEDMWSLLKIFISNLRAEENKTVFATLCQVHKVPQSIKGDFWTTSYIFFKSLPERANRSSLLNKLRHRMTDVIEFLDPDFIANFYLESFDDNFVKQQCEDLNNISIYILSGKDVEIQKTRYIKVLVPILDKAFTSWDVNYKGKLHVRHNISNIFKYMLNEFDDHVLNKDVPLPIEILNSAYEKLNKSLPINENYVLINMAKLLKRYAEILGNMLDVKTKDAYKKLSTDGNGSAWTKLLHKEAVPEFCKVVVDYFKADIKTFFPSIHFLFAAVLQKHFYLYNPNVQLLFLKAILEYEDSAEGYLLILKLLPSYIHTDEGMSLKTEILDKIKAHPSKEVNMHYWFSSHRL